jgi:cyclic beta-1,2-glucan synthetase
MSEPSIQMHIEPEQAERYKLTSAEEAELREQASRAARSCGWLPGKRHSGRPREIFRNEARALAALERDLYNLKSDAPTDDLQWLYDNLRLVRTDIQDLTDSTKILAKLPLVRTSGEEVIPRCVVLARALVVATNYRLTEAAFSVFLEAVQETEPLRLSELGGLLPAIKLALLETIADRGRRAYDAFRAQGLDAPSYDIGSLIQSLRLIGEIDWKETLEQLAIVHRVLLLDPAGVYGRMDFISREYYRKAVAKIAARSDVGEIDLARLAVTLAEEAKIERTTPEALRDRLRHVGYYLVDDIGRQELLNRVGYRPSVAAYIQRTFRRYPDELYIIGIEFVTLITVVALIMSIVRTHTGFGVIAGAILLILPATQAAVELMNYFVTTVLTPRILPKLDFSKGVDPNCATMVAIPTLLLNEKQIRGLVDDLEVRYLVNHDRNIYFALLTDLPDTAEPVGEHDARVDLAIRLIDELNRKYAGEPHGGFYLFHRHRVYNPREGAWMGWERKRGKLLDLNQMLRKVFDPFPVKAGDLSRLPHIRYVLTLDSDTQLPRGSAQRMIGAMAHPLNRPLVDPELNIVTQGYGILQPRVGISVQSATRSRLASIYSGQTGFDIYSRAISDVYQDLYGEGIFTGKGIYDVDALRQVLEHRFPRNALLSHDLIEGAYARAGLVSDIEVIDDYPSHYSAYNRRKHRWLRGDWQIVRWVFNRVPNESRRLVQNPISLVSRWKIVDNLRRSMMEPATFALLVAGWFFLPGGPRFWTLVTVALLFLPIYFRLIFALIRAISEQSRNVAREAFGDFITSHVNIALNIAFLAHQTLVALDAIIRTIIRSTITHSRLLEWETATEAELGLKKRTPVDVYLNWVPVIAVCLGLCLYFRPGAAGYALPFIIAWICSTLISNWLNRSPLPEDYALSKGDLRFVREVALRTWRYFSEFSNEKNNWLIPDNIQEEPYRIAERISPTNLGLLFNSRQAALELGYLTISEFVKKTELTLASIWKLPRFFGHFVNWYDTVTMRPIDPLFISSVDSGNLIASLWSLKQGCLELLHRPLIRKSLLDGLNDHCCLACIKRSNWDTKHPDGWIPRALTEPRPSGSGLSDERSYWTSEFHNRIDALREDVRSFMPWYLPEFEPLRNLAGFDLPTAPLTPENAAVYYQDLDRKLQTLAGISGIPPEALAAAEQLRAELPACRGRVNALASRIQALAKSVSDLADEMDFSMLADKRRNLLSIGYDVNAKELAKSCYDLLASEARTAAFIAVARGEIVEECWFRLGRQHTVCERETVLISWTGTMFEYLMPAIWMKSHPNTLLDRAVRSAVRAQQSYAKHHGVPWGISEAAYSKRDLDGNYQYAAFGVPGLALNVARAGSLVISPYSSCLALTVDAATAVENLIRMKNKHWLATYGFYESVDFTSAPPRKLLPRKGELVRCWMAHHQGMSLATICNLLHDSPFQRWFMAEPVALANELILQERPLRVRPITDTQPRRVISFPRRQKGMAAKARASA